MSPCFKSLASLLLCLGACEAAAQTSPGITVQIPEVGSTVKWNRVQTEELSVSDGARATVSQTTIDSTVVAWTIRSLTPAESSWVDVEIDELLLNRRRRTAGGSSSPPVWLETTKPDSQIVFVFRVNLRTGDLERIPGSNRPDLGIMDQAGRESLVGIRPALAWIHRDRDIQVDGYRFLSNEYNWGDRCLGSTLDSSWKRSSTTSFGCPAGHVCASMSSTTTVLTTIKRIESVGGTSLRSRSRPISDNSWHTLRSRLDADPYAVVRWSELQGRSGRSSGKKFLESRLPSRGSATFLDVRFSDRTSWTGCVLLQR